MDADGSHAPEQLPRLLAAFTAGADLVLGSRWVPGGEAPGWPVGRRLISRAGSAYAPLALGVPVHDVTGGYWVFRRELLDRIDYASVASYGYCFQVEMAWRAVTIGAAVIEEPIIFVDRRCGVSKMSGAIVREAFRRVTVWGVHHRLHQLRTLAGGRTGTAIAAEPGATGRESGRSDLRRTGPRHARSGAEPPCPRS